MGRAALGHTDCSPPFSSLLFPLPASGTLQAIKAIFQPGHQQAGGVKKAGAHIDVPQLCRTGLGAQNHRLKTCGESLRVFVKISEQKKTPGKLCGVGGETEA